MKKLFISVVILCMCVSVGYAEWADGGPFGSTDNFLKRALSSASNPWDVLYVDTIHVSGSGERITGVTYSEYIDFDDAGDDFISFGGSGGAADSIIKVDLDGDPEILSDTGTLILGGVDGTNNENITFDCETTSNQVIISSSTGAAFSFSQATKWSDNLALRFGNSNDIEMKWVTTGNDSFQIGTAVNATASSGYISILEKGDENDVDRSPLAVTPDPTLRIYSADADVATDYLEFSHNATNAIIGVGGGVLYVPTLASVPDEITATGEGVAASIATINTEVTTNGDSDLDDVTLANGVSGQEKSIYCVVEGNAADTWKITPATMAGGTQITFAGVGEGCTLKYADNEGWTVTGNNGGAIS